MRRLSLQARAALAEKRRRRESIVVTAAVVEELSRSLLQLRLTSTNGAEKVWDSKFNNDPDGQRMAEEWCQRLIGRIWG